MNKELRELLNKINAKKVEAKNLLAENKIEEAKAAKEELEQLQAKFNIMKDLYDEEEGEIQNQIEDGTAKAATDKKVDATKAFVNVFIAAAQKKSINPEDMEVLNMMTQADPVEGISDGGITVPKDIRTQIKELRRSQDALETLVNVEPVTTLSGSRVMEVNADQVPFDNVEEAAEFPEVATPQFRNIEYKVKKKGGILKVTRELLQDTAENILGYLRRWISKKAKTTRNFLILSQLEESFGGDKTISVASIDDLKDIFNVKLDPAIALSSKVLTNQDGFNWLDKLKDEDGKYILQPNPTNATEKRLFGRYPVVVVANKVMASEEGQVPIFCGDFAEAVTIFDRENLSIEFSTEAGDLWSKDLTGVKVRERLDIKTVDEEAVIKGEITIEV
ncbi:phage major capsid protein [Clostridium formicaceticum]|uniref:Capsid protein n=1 Tax=Clostridium formicaceticum TaxID=1497 RepID=A0AAC9RHJ0_9CLOT|nr:phage major capsid protein [Clostridium formicaceticum]AOY76678.1 capsid protein [Clostridium formicaceticum]ARE87109.1 Phage capsid family protein [Clostridium formicaceticum]